MHMANSDSSFYFCVMMNSLSDTRLSICRLNIYMLANRLALLLLLTRTREKVACCSLQLQMFSLFPFSVAHFTVELLLITTNQTWPDSMVFTALCTHKRQIGNIGYVCYTCKSVVILMISILLLEYKR